ncbi:telomerase protein component 1 isoform X1 [Lingula anatina]|uniref:Telomerase protein component 1 isoform X1 n=1 Tax=Lingula anatina TaxID=7574 RepID=A0A1S3J9Z1_LINAN|nr:telomerase protein component 1 isoform X1 [Lingula anatina]XP_013407035.1 telomerase protein component 1 isoform X1 [Lingula anatina]|eukprot:XP_013407026.1 telomerase protein component 1 isoform X1 [Lingula anatina]
MYNMKETSVSPRLQSNLSLSSGLRLGESGRTVPVISLKSSLLSGSLLAPHPSMSSALHTRQTSLNAIKESNETKLNLAKFTTEVNGRKKRVKSDRADDKKKREKKEKMLVSKEKSNTAVRPKLQLTPKSLVGSGTPSVMSSVTVTNPKLVNYGVSQGVSHASLKTNLGLDTTSSSLTLGMSSYKLTKPQNVKPTSALTTGLSVLATQAKKGISNTRVSLLGSQGLASSSLCQAKLGSLKSSASIPPPGTGLSGLSSNGKKPEKPPVKSKKKLTSKQAENVNHLPKDVAPAPLYDFYMPEWREEKLDKPKFTTPEMDGSIARITQTLDDVTTLKRNFVNAVSASLLSAPDFKNPKDSTRLQLMSMAQQLAAYDPEFILKVALYTRQELNIRTTANFLLAFSSFGSENGCRPYLRKYYGCSIQLPSDWIDVAEQYQTFHDKSLKEGSLPVALRKAMAAKFQDFDKYQLAKYNKEKSKKKKAKKEKDTSRKSADRAQPVFKPSKKAESDSDSDSSDDEDFLNFLKDSDSETEEEREQKTFTLKQLIRKIHITEPVEHVMCLIGKRYPETLEEFYKSRLPGTWDEERAGKRMKLPTPETWETQVSMKGNKAEVWQDLLEHKKLPFMAMLRNLRNMIKAGISEKYTTKVIKRLTDVRSVVNSRQFPFRFFSAYEVLNSLEKEYEQNQKQLVEEAVAGSSSWSRGRGRGRGCGRGGRGGGRGGRWDKKKNAKTKEVPFDPPLLNRYRKALDTAIKIATTYNVQPIKGTTVIFCNLGKTMNRPCTAAKGLGKPRQVSEIAVLLGLMCKYSCEESKMVVYGNSSYLEVDLEKGTILDNMQSVLGSAFMVNNQQDTDAVVPDGILRDLLRDRTQVDNLIILSDGMSLESVEGQNVSDFLKKYRRLVNPNMLFVNVDLGGKSSGFNKSVQPEHDNDIFIAGYSDQILRFIAERGESGQLTHIDKIDEKYNLTAKVPGLEKKPYAVKPAVEHPLPIAALKPRWRTARVFISSTFRDMHGERDLLTRFVFPELRARGKQHFLNVYEVDLRWGVTEEDTRSNKTLELCLTEITKCQFFIGILGERYGWVPDKYVVPDSPEFDWVRDYPPGCSITELEMHSACMSNPDEKKDQAFFFLRDKSWQKDLPKKYLQDFAAESPSSATKMEALKERIRSSGLEVFDGYPCKWGGVVDGQPMVSGLEDFGFRTLNCLWNAVKKFFPDEDAVLDEISHETSQHEAFLEARVSSFTGRKAQMKMCLERLRTMKEGILMLSGKPGCGKTSLVANLISQYDADIGAKTHFIHFVGATPESTNITFALKRLCTELIRRFGLEMDVPQDYKNLCGELKTILTEASQASGSPLLLVFDGLEMLEDYHQARSLTWIPEEIPENVIFLMSTVENSECHRALSRRQHSSVQLSGLDLWDKPEVVRNQLARHKKTLVETGFNNQMKLLTSKREANNPLFLNLACEELRVFGVYEKITEKLKSLPHTVPLLLQEVLARLEQDHGQSLVSTALTLLVCARKGLFEEELHMLLSYHQKLQHVKYTVQDVLNVPLEPEHQIPQAVFAPLLRSLKTFLRPEATSSLLSLAHAEIERSIRQRYMRGSSTELEVMLHRLLAGYFWLNADPDKNGSWQGSNQRAFSELTYHLSCTGAFSELEDILCSLKFLRAKCMLGQASELLEDFLVKGASSKSQERSRQKFLSQPRIVQYQSFVSRNLHVLSSVPALTWQQALNEPESSAPAQDIQSLLESVDMDLGLIKWKNKPEWSDPCLLTLSDFTMPVTCLAISPDGQFFVCGSDDCVVRLYDLNTGKEQRSFTGHSHTISDVCFVGKDKICSASLDQTLSLWDLNDGHRISVMKGNNRRVSSCSSDAKGSIIVSTAWDCYIKVWQGKDGVEVSKFTDVCPVNCVAFHPEGQLIVTGSWDASLKIWDTLNKNRKAILRGHSSSVRSVAYSPSGRHIASASLDGEVRLWNAANGTQVGTLSGHTLPVNKLVFSPAGQELITVSDDHKIKVWSGHLGQPVNSIGQEEYGAATSVALSRNGQYVVVGYHEGQTRRFDIRSGLLDFEVHHHQASVKCVHCVDHRESVIITGSADNTALALDPLTGKALFSLTGHTNSVLCIDSRLDWLATGSEDFQARMFDRKRGGPPYAVLSGHVAPVTGCSFNAEGSLLVTSCRGACLMVWNIQDLFPGDKNIPMNVISACHADWVNGCMWSNTGDFVVTASNDFNLKLWDILKATPKEKLTMTGHMAAVNAVAYKYGCIVSASSDGQMKVWSHKGTEITTLYGHKLRANACDIFVQVQEKDKVEEETNEVSDWATEVETEEWKAEHEKSMKGKKDIKVEDVMVASCGDDGMVWIWRPLQGNQLGTLLGHSDRVISVAAGIDKVCSSSLDKTIKMWQNEFSKTMTRDSHDAEISAMTWSADGQYAITASRDGHVRVWSFEEDSSKKTYLKCQCSFKAHQHAITGVCFVSLYCFAVSSEDGTASQWKIDSNEKRIAVRKLKPFGNTMPINCITSCDGHIWFAKWDKRLYSFNQRYEEKIYPLQDNQQDFHHTHWILDMTARKGILSGDMTYQVCTVGAAGTVKEYAVSIKKPKADLMHCTEIKPPADVKGRGKSPANWLLCTGCHNNKIYVGDSSGQLSVLHSPGKCLPDTKKVHASAINSVQIVGEEEPTIFTASSDKTIKVWDHQMKQIGQYFTQSPVMKLAVQPSSGDQSTRLVLCGDQLGNVLVLEWIGNVKAPGTKTDGKVTLFWNHTSPFSQWYPAKFTLDGQKFSCAEQYMMYSKAMMFSDKKTADLIMSTNSPKEQKELGRKVKGFQPDVWGALVDDVVKKANMAKFTQNGHLKKLLLGTGSSMLAEASAEDRIWGTGLSAEHKQAYDMAQWPGKNKLGKILCEVRESCRK